MNAVPELMFTILPSPCARISGITACIATIGANTLRWKISSKSAGSISSTEARIAAPRVVDEPVYAAVMPVHGAYGFPHAIKLRHVYRDRRAAWKLPRQFLQRIGAASE